MSRNVCFCWVGLYTFENVLIALYVSNYFETRKTYKGKVYLTCNVYVILRSLFEIFFVPVNI